MAKILIAEDEQAINHLIKWNLELVGHTCAQVYDGNAALAAAGTGGYDLMILDVMLPGLSGFEILPRLQGLPVIFVTAKAGVADRLRGLQLGADDYITKPFNPVEIVARVKAQLRRYKRYNTGIQPDEDVIIRGALVLNVKTHECTLNEKPLSLTPTEFSILKLLCQRGGNVVSSEELFREVWGDEYFTKNNNTITVHIRHLREKMGDSFESPRYIKTVWGVGYKIEG